MSILVTGGAGYIGAHVVRLLRERSDEVVVVDDLSTGDASRIGDTTLVELDLSTPEATARLTELMTERGVTDVIHFAAKKQVGESVERPTLYYRHNVGGLTAVIDAMEAVGATRLIFSSSAATYGTPSGDDDAAYLAEDAVCAPLSPYGETKLIGEWLCRDAEASWGLRWSALRYFNVAGAGWDDLGDPAALNLVPIVFDALEAERRPKVFGNDYPTPDGTCIRDYVHVLDLAEAHLACVDHLRADAPSAVFNVGTGTGSSVLEVLDVIASVTGIDTAYDVVARRAGDPPVLAADTTRIAEVVGWRPQRDLKAMVASAWQARVAGRA